METWMWIALLVLALAIGAVAAWVILRRRTTGKLRDRFGPEYERTLEETGSRREAELELRRREERVEHLEIRSLAEEERARFAERWEDVQARFVDDPTETIADGDELVAEVMRARGYPVGDFEQRAADISVDHPRVVEHYRAARAIAARNERGVAGTEELRQAMQHYRTLFEVLLERRTDRPMEEPHERAAGSPLTGTDGRGLGRAAGSPEGAGVEPRPRAGEPAPGRGRTRPRGRPRGGRPGARPDADA